MSDKSVYCPRCKLKVTGGKGVCPSCGGPSVSHLEMATPHKPKPALTLETVIIAALVTAIVVLFLGQQRGSKATVQVERTEVTYCRGSEEKLSEKSAVITVPVAEQYSYEKLVEIYVPCTEEETPEVSKVRVIIKGGDIDIRRGGEWDQNQHGTEWGMDLRPIKAGMTHSQVYEAWGEYLASEKIDRGEDSTIERWVYGDPLFGIRITGRYVDFEGEEVLEAYMDVDMERLYDEIVQERQSGLY